MVLKKYWLAHDLLGLSVDFHNVGFLSWQMKFAAVVAACLVREEESYVPDQCETRPYLRDWAGTRVLLVWSASSKWYSVKQLVELIDLFSHYLLLRKRLYF